MKITNTSAAIAKVGKLLREQLVFTMYRDDTWATARTAATIKEEPLQRGVKIVGSEVMFVIDEGRRPGTLPPQRAIEQWVRAKNLKPATGGTIKNMVRLIRNSIAERGTIARYNYGGTDILDRVIKDNTDEMEELVLDGFIADIQAFLDNTPSEITI